MTTTDRSLPTIRLELADRRATLRLHEDALDFARALAETTIIAAAGAGDLAAGEKALGSNQAARDRALELALGADTTYQAFHAEVRGCQHRVERLQAEVDGARDLRRDQELEVRRRLIELAESGHPIEGI